MKRELVRTAAFIRALRRHLKKNPQAASDLESTLTMLSDDAFDPRLKSHKLKGAFDGIWACTAGYDLRILFEFVREGSAEKVLLLTIGTHDEVY